MQRLFFRGNHTQITVRERLQSDLESIRTPFAGGLRARSLGLQLEGIITKLTKEEEKELLETIDRYPSIGTPLCLDLIC